jgi:hypothetical protein
MGWPLRIRAALLGALPLACPGIHQAAGLTTLCHIHPPAELVERGAQPATIGPYTGEDACEAERLDLFGGQGRCHCVQSFGGSRRFAPGPEPDGPAAPASGRDLTPPLP